MHHHASINISGPCATLRYQSETALPECIITFGRHQDAGTVYSKGVLSWLRCAAQLPEKSRDAGVRQQSALVSESMLGNPTERQNGVLSSPAEALRSYLAQAVLALELSQSCLHLLKALQHNVQPQ